MRISELVNELGKMRNQYGDVYVENDKGTTVEVEMNSENGVVVIS